MSIRRSRSSRTLLSICALLAVASLVACQQAPEAPVEAPPQRIENAALGIAIADLPDVFRVRTNEGDVLELVPSDETVEGVLTVTTHVPETAAINLVAAVERHQADIESRPDGDFKGQRELGSPLGTAFYSRGQFTEGGRAMEETAILMVHPAGDRELHLVYVYPSISPEDTASRLQDQLFEVLGELEGLAAAPSDEPAAEAGAETESTEAPAG